MLVHRGQHRYPWTRHPQSRRTEQALEV
jgi:hypothetical protein